MTMRNKLNVNNVKSILRQRQRRRLDVAIVGPPNAGKSQLLNVLTRSSVAAVSRKRHTSRSEIFGIRTVDDVQIVFKDTPGFMKLENAKEERLDRELIVTAAAAMNDVDYSLLVVDSVRQLTDNYRHALCQLMVGAINSNGRIEDVDNHDNSNRDNSSRKDVIKNGSATVNIGQDTFESSQNGGADCNDDNAKLAIVLNKVDLVKPKHKLINLAMDIGSLADYCLKDQFDKHGNQLDFEAMMKYSPIVFYVSALKEDGTDELLNHLVQRATPSWGWIVKPGEPTTMTNLEQLEEIIREKIYRYCHREVPHSIRQVNRMFRKVSTTTIINKKQQIIKNKRSDCNDSSSDDVAPKSNIVIHQDLVVFTKSHHRLVTGSGGRTLAKIKTTAERDLCKLFRCKVFLFLHVKSKIGKRNEYDDGIYYTRAAEEIISLSKKN